ncbi:MSHA biogenesis protein MshQ [Shewanella avicenniae]|uniref:MSHA biogenesis protein MshQ n=1 Tax=Shewanella avicenniae TaxID=2814294 RepID=A0ABX7QQH6_9GAMM|nr:DUF6701 domain-containing protein [Shewanella avicenniae]QSX33235.1 MSHA biogenesis protein MshQ [Shewanella avicenniae]
MPTQACDSVTGGRDYCAITNQTSTALSLSGSNSYRVSSGDYSITYCQDNDSITLGNSSQTQFANVSLYSRCSLSFASQHQEYRLKAVAVGGGATVTLSNGDYWIESLALNSNGHILIEGNVRLFVKDGALSSGDILFKDSNSALLVVAYNTFAMHGSSKVDGDVYTHHQLQLDDTSSISGRVTAGSLVMTGTSSINYVTRPPSLTCFNDDFTSALQSARWVVARSNGSFTPSSINGRLRLTENAGNQATSATFQRLFPTNNNLITIEFNHYAYGGNGADGIAFVLSDAAVTPQPGAFGGPLGYGFKPGIGGFAGGWLGVGIDEYGNFSNEGGSYNIGYRPQTVAIRGSGRGVSGYRYLHGACNDGQYWNSYGHCLAPKVDDNNNANFKYRMTYDSRTSGKALVQLERDSGSGYQTLIPSFDVISQSGQAPLPASFMLSLTGSTGGSNNIHELDNFKICAADSTAISSTIDHFEFEYAGSPLTCEPLAVTIKACNNPSCSELYTERVTARLSPSTAADSHWVGGSTVTFTGGVTTVSLKHTTAGIVTVGVDGSEPLTKAFSETLCKRSGAGLSHAACSISFADSGFVFDVPDKLAGKPVDVQIKAVKKDDVTQQCTTLFKSTNKDINFWSSALEDPIISNTQVMVNNAPVFRNAANPTETSLSFNASGIANMTVNFDDAGKLELLARYTGSGDEAGLVLEGRDSFVSFPVGLCVSSSESETVCPSRDATCKGYRATGDAFGLNVRAKSWQSDNDQNICDNPDTPSFAMNNISLSHRLIAPSSGALGELSVKTYNQVASLEGTSITQQAISEVGVFEIAASTNSQQLYLGSNAFNLPAYYSDAIGRIYPKQFVAESVSMAPSCGSFSYMTQPIATSLTLKALDHRGHITQNYSGAFAFGVPQLLAENGNDGVDLSSRLSSISGSWVNGQMAFSNVLFTFARDAAPNADGPYFALDVGVAVNDPDRVPMSFADMLVTAATDCAADSSCTAKRLATLDMRLGRAVLNNSYGPENQPVLMSGETEFWNGSQWQTNVADSCSVITPTMLSQTSNASLGYLFEPELSSGQTISRFGDPAAVSAGRFGLRWLSSGEYRGKVTAPVSVSPWLLWYWGFDGATEALQEPRASAYFGRYRGNDRVINRRELH